MTRKALFLEALCCAFLVVLFCHPHLRLGSMQSGGDAANLFWPIKYLLTESFWRDGVVPLWNPYSFMGTPLLASLQHAVFYPVDWVLYALFPPHMGLGLGNLLHLVSAGVGTFFWLRVGLHLTRIPSIFIGAAFPCAAWFWGQQEHINQVAAVSYLPWQALTTWMLLSGRLRIPVFAAAYSGISFLQFTTGHPQEAFYAHLFCALLVIGKIAVERDRLQLLGRVVPGFIFAGIIAGFLVCVQLIPTLELQGHSRRQFRDPLYALSFSMPPDVLITYINPHNFGSFAEGYYVRDDMGNIVPDEAGNPAWDRRAYNEYGLFIGVPALLLLFCGAAGVRRKLIWGLLLIAIFSLLLALGGNTDPWRMMAGEFAEIPQPGYSLHELFIKLVPPAQGFRVPARISILATFAFLTVAAFGAVFLEAKIREEKRRILFSIIVGLAVFISLYLPAGREKFHFPVEMEPTLALLKGTRLERKTLDNRLFRLAIGDDASLVSERHLETTFAAGNPIMNRFVALQPHMNVPVYWPSVDGYEEGLVPTARLKDFLYHFNRNFRQYRPDPVLLSLLGVRYIYSDLPVDEDVYSVAREHAFPGRPMYENPLAQGAAFWRSQAQGVDFPRLDGPFWRGGAPHQEIQREEATYGAPINWQAAESPPLRTEIVSANRLRILIPHLSESAQPGDALLAMGWYPGWIFPSDGEEVAFASAVHAELPAKKTRLLNDQGMEWGWELAYRPFSYRIGLFFSGLGVFLWVGFVIFGRNRKFRNNGA